MARYIDADKVIKFIKEANDMYPFLIDENEKCRVCDLIESQPDADVVPKSELSIIGVQNMALENTNVDLQRRLVIAEAVASSAVGKASEMIAEAKCEVAREIFDEIENEINKELKNNKKVLPQIEISDVLWNRVSGRINALLGMRDFIADLKKKYKEAKSDE